MSCCHGQTAVEDRPVTPAPTGPHVEAFERMKGLAGEWEGTSTDGKDIHLTYTVASKRSIVIEVYKHFYKGVLMEDEMVTVYHLDGDDLVCTHYCTLGNQPRMRAEIEGPDRIHFKFVRATNLLHPECLRMSGVNFHFLGDDRFTQTWFWYGKKKYVAESNHSDDYDEIEDDIDPNEPGKDVFTMARTR